MCSLVLGEGRRRDQHAQDGDPDAKPSLHVNTPAGVRPAADGANAVANLVQCNDSAIGVRGNLPHSGSVVGQIVRFFEDGPDPVQDNSRTASH
jgi:hypothetical protein